MIYKYHSLLALPLLLTCIVWAGKEEGACPDSTCDDYLTQREAQAAFDADLPVMKDSIMMMTV